MFMKSNKPFKVMGDLATIGSGYASNIGRSVNATYGKGVDKIVNAIDKGNQNYYKASLNNNKKRFKQNTDNINSVYQRKLNDDRFDNHVARRDKNSAYGKEIMRNRMEEQKIHDGYMNKPAASTNAKNYFRTSQGKAVLGGAAVVGGGLGYIASE